MYSIGSPSTNGRDNHLKTVHMMGLGPHDYGCIGSPHGFSGNELGFDLDRAELPWETGHVSPRKFCVKLKHSQRPRPQNGRDGARTPLWKEVPHGLSGNDLGFDLDHAKLPRKTGHVSKP